MRTKVALCAAMAMSLVFAMNSTARAEHDYSTLRADEVLNPGQIFTDGCYFYAIMQTDGNFVYYADSTPLWSTHTQGQGGYAAMQSDGNFVIYNWNDQPVWSTHTFYPYSRFVTYKSGELVMLTPSNDHAFSAYGYVGEILAQTPCMHMPSKTVLLSNTNIPGNDFNVIAPDQARASWCGFFCNQDSACKAYTYTPPDSSNIHGLCWLKNAVGAAESASGMTSGKVVRF